MFPSKGIRALNLTAKYVILHKVALVNWKPSGSYAATVRKDLAKLL